MGLFDFLGGNKGRAKGTYRTRQEGGIFSSLIGALIGVGLIVVVGPLLAWFAESQNRAEDFAGATVVESSSVESGYVVVQDTADTTKNLLCPVAFDAPADTKDTNCLYVEETVEEYDYEITEQEGTLESNQIEIRYIEDVCDSDGTNCESVYEVEEYDWEQVENTEEYVPFTLGSYTVTPSGNSNFIGEKTFTEYDASGFDYIGGYDVGDLRYTYTYMGSDQEILVGGISEDGTITGTYDGEPYVVSTMSLEGTAAELEAQDAGAKWGLRIASFFAMVFGAVMVAGPLMMLTNVFKLIPFLGKRVDKGVDSVISFFAAVVGVVLWMMVYFAVLVLKNIWLVLLAFGLIGIVVLVLVKKGKKDDDSTSSPEPAAAPASTPVASATPAPAVEATPAATSATEEPKVEQPTSQEPPAQQ